MRRSVFYSIEDQVLLADISSMSATDFFHLREISSLHFGERGSGKYIPASLRGRSEEHVLAILMVIEKHGFSVVLED